MKKEDVGFWLLLIGVSMVLYLRAWTLYKGGIIGKQWTSIWKLDWISQWQNVAALFVTAGTILLWKKIQ